METYNNESRVIVNQLNHHAMQLMINENKSAYETKTALIDKGISPDNASILVENLENQIKGAKYDKARKDMVFGALWFAGGTIATLADIGFVFWGAILFGGIQFFKGVINLNS